MFFHRSPADSHPFFIIFSSIFHFFQPVVYPWMVDMDAGLDPQLAAYRQRHQQRMEQDLEEQRWRRYGPSMALERTVWT